MKPALYVALALLYLIPIWSVDHPPTSDGPSHLYNSWILRELIAGENDAVSRYYAIDWRPHPNWIGHALLAILMSVVPPAVAEKILFSGIVLLFLFSIWIYCQGRPHALFAFPFAYNQFLQFGFYNYSISIALFFLILAVWWRRRDRPDAKTIAIVALLLLLCYFSHPLSTILAMMSIGVFWLLTLRGRPLLVHARHLLAFVPVIPLLLWFAKQRGTAHVGGPPFKERVLSLIRVDPLYSFDLWQFKLGFAMTFLLIVLGVTTLIRERRREVDIYIALLSVFIVIYFFAPDALAGGLGVTHRILIFIYLLPLPWFTSRLPQRTFIALFALMALGNLAYLLDRHRTADDAVRNLLRAVEPITPETTLLPLLATRQPRHTYVAAYSHALDYIAIQKRLVDLDNYEPGTDYFPIKFREGVTPVNVYPIEATPDQVDVASFAARAQYIFTWQMGRYTPIDYRIQEHYRLVSEIGAGRLYRSYILEPPSIARLPMILLPIAGTAGKTAGWRVDQHVRNAGRSAVHLVLSTCAERCEFDLAAGQTMALASADARMPFIIVYPMRGAGKDLIFSTVVSYAGNPVVAIPAIHENELWRRKIRIADVPFGGAKLNLRAFFFGSGTNLFTIRVLSRDGRVLGQKVEGIDPVGFFTDGDFTREFPQVPSTDFVDVEIDTGSDDLRLWAFITATGFSGERVRLHLPR